MKSVWERFKKQTKKLFGRRAWMFVVSVTFYWCKIFFKLISNGVNITNNRKPKINILFKINISLELLTVLTWCVSTFPLNEKGQCCKFFTFMLLLEKYIVISGNKEQFWSSEIVIYVQVNRYLCLVCFDRFVHSYPIGWSGPGHGVWNHHAFCSS